MTGPGNTLEEELAYLLAPAEEGGEAQLRLLALQDAVQRGVMITPGDRRFLDRLHVLRSNVECRYMDQRDGRCRARRGVGRCPHLAAFRECSTYMPALGDRRGAPNTREVLS